MSCSLGPSPVGYLGPMASGTTSVDERAAGIRSVGDLFKPGMKVALTTHVNADGDGTGCEVAMVHLLAAIGVTAEITNPTPFPDRFKFMLEGIEARERSREAIKRIGKADVVLVLDTGDRSRLGNLAGAIDAAGVPVACIDHHVTDGSLPDGPRFIDPEASATGELIWELAATMGWDVGVAAARGMYVALMTDTGGFRFANTTSSVMTVAGQLLERGVDPEEIYARVYANAPEGRVRLLAEVLSTLVVEPEVGLAWVTVPSGALERNGATSDDLEGVVEHPRSIEGVRLALLFRELASGRTKVSFRSMGDVDVAELAGKFDGGGHRKAAGASLAEPLAEAQAIVLEAARQTLS